MVIIQLTLLIKIELNQVKLVVVFGVMMVKDILLVIMMEVYLNHYTFNKWNKILC